MSRLEAVILKCVAKMWVLVTQDNPIFPKYLGSGNPSRYDPIHFTRSGDEVKVTKEHEGIVVDTISADTIVKGLPEFEGKPLSEVMDENIIYDHDLIPVE